MFQLQSKTRGTQTAFIEESVGNSKLVTAFSREEKCLEEFDEINERYAKYSLKAIFYSSLTNPCTRFVNSMVYAAVGLAGAAISATVNELAGPFLGNFMFMIIAIILLVFGHGLNMILNVLSVIVHGIRLNTLEFSSHLDMSWSGHKFKPFEE